MPHSAPIQLGELCRRLGVPERHARYVLEEGVLPEGVEREPDRGNHRRLTPAQAFWLGIVLKLKQSAVKVSLAAKIADFAKLAVSDVSFRLSSDHDFAPFHGRLVTSHRWYVDVGDLDYIRLVTDSSPGFPGLHEFPWSHVGRHFDTTDVTPAVIIRVDLARIGRMLHNPYMDYDFRDDQGGR